MGLFSFSGDKDKKEKDKAERKESMNRIRARVTGKKPEKPPAPQKEQDKPAEKKGGLFDDEDEPSFESKEPVDGPSKDNLDLDIEPRSQEKKPAPEPRNEPKKMAKKVPDAPETKEIDVPEIDKGPLFIRVEKFKKVRRMVQQLQRTGEDMKTKMAGLQTTLKEDRDTEDNLDNTMKDLNASIEQMKDMLSP